jgi:hypothetical protein
MNNFNISGGVWNTTTITEVPEIELSNWQIFQIGKDCHFVGYNITEGEGRVSSKIINFDKNTLRGITNSGRVYQLHGHSGYDKDAQYVWQRWLVINRVNEYTDITSTIEEIIL